MINVALTNSESRENGSSKGIDSERVQTKPYLKR